jgi:predicted Rossmann fold nucleotide-binding protein DprA/Smf involved in DNA uptake
MKNIFKKIEDKKIPRKNYYIVFGVSIFVILLSLYIRTIYLKYNADKLESGIFYNKAINQINTQDFNFAMLEANEAIVYVSYRGNNKIDRMENRLLKEIENKDLIDRVIYWDVTDLKNKEYIRMSRNKYPNVAIDINEAPLLIYIKNGEALVAKDSSNGMIGYKTLQDIINKYGIE